MDFPCPLPLAARALLFIVASVPAAAQTYRPDAEAYPCARGPQFTVVQSDSGFSIPEKAEKPFPPAAPTGIRLGNSLTFDSRLFARTSLVRPEPDHVSQR